MFSVFILSLVQSVCEFLPISSSGHLLLMKELGISAQTIGMDVLLHFGTLLAVLIYFHKDVLNLIKVLQGKGDKKLFINLMVATAPILIVGFLFFNVIRGSLRSPYLVALNSIFWGIMLWGVDKFFPKKEKMSNMTLKQSFYIGCAQVLSLVPGTSRSGITMTCARALGINRSESARFSMLLSIPTICMAVGCVCLKGINNEIQMPELKLATAGIIFSAILGFLAISFFMKWVKKSSFGIFALYRVLLGLFVLIYMMI